MGDRRYDKIRRDETERISKKFKERIIKYVFGYILCSRKTTICKLTNTDDDMVQLMAFVGDSYVSENN